MDFEGKGGNGKLRILTDEQASEFTTDLDASVVREKQNETEVTASWFQILNSFFIIAFAPVFSRMWASRFNPSAPVKFGMGLILLGLGFGALAIASRRDRAGCDDGGSQHVVADHCLPVSHPR